MTPKNAIREIPEPFGAKSTVLMQFGYQNCTRNLKSGDLRNQNYILLPLQSVSCM